jgi:hypothetical protein
MTKQSLSAEWIADQLRATKWHTASGGSQTCVKVAFLAEGIVALGDTERPDAVPLLFTDAEYEAFVTGIMRGKLRRNTVV